MEYKIIEKNDYKINKKYYISLIKNMFENDNNKIANIDEIENHLDFIFNENYENNSFLILQVDNNELISMINAFEYNNVHHDWCFFSLFIKKNYRRKGYGEKILKFALKYVKNYECLKVISGIEEDNIASIELHKKVGFKYANCNWDELACGFPKNHLGFLYNFE